MLGGSLVILYFLFPRCVSCQAAVVLPSQYLCSRALEVSSICLLQVLKMAPHTTEEVPVLNLPYCLLGIAEFVQERCYQCVSTAGSLWPFICNQKANLWCTREKSIENLLP